MGSVPVDVPADPSNTSANWPTGLVNPAPSTNRPYPDVATESLVLEMSGSEAKVDSLLAVLQPYGVIELVRAGRIAMERRVGAESGGPVPAGCPDEDGISYSV